MTNKIALRSVEEFLLGYKPSYNPILPLFLNNAQAYTVEAGKIDFKRADTVGDIRAKMVGPKAYKNSLFPQDLRARQRNKP